MLAMDKFLALLAIDRAHLSIKIALRLLLTERLNLVMSVLHTPFSKYILEPARTFSTGKYNYRRSAGYFTGGVRHSAKEGPEICLP